MEFGFVRFVLKKKSKMLSLEDLGINREMDITRIATLNPVVANENDSIFRVVETILIKGFRRLPIVNKKSELVGIITYTDILDAFLRNENFDQKISYIMTREVTFCKIGDTVEKVIQKMKFSRRGGLPLLKDRKVIGIVTERDIINNFVEREFGMKVKDIMTEKPFFFQPTLSIFDVVKTLVSTKYRRFPVVENGKVVGIVTGIDLLRYIYENKYNIEALDEDMERVVRKDVFKILEDEDLSTAIRTMKEKKVGGLIVVDKENFLKGIITERNIIDKII
jgi:CBS domain-containing protein